MKTAPQKIKVLHLEDQASDAEQIARLLKKSNSDFEFFLVDTREEYKKALIEYAPEIIISDHSLQGFNSMEALEILQQSGLRIPFILVTGAVSEEFAVEAMRRGADDYVLKDRPQRLSLAVSGALEKYRLERQRKITETRLRNINTNSIDIICSIDEEGRFIHVSAACLEIWGYQASALEGMRFLDLVLDEDREMTIKVAASIADGVQVTMFENRYVRKNGTIVPMLWSARWEASDRITYCIAKDATEKKRIEGAFSTEQQRFIELFLDAPASIGILKGPNHIYEVTNPLHEEITGKKNMIGKTVAEVSPELASQGLIDLLDIVYQRGESFSCREMLFNIDREGTGKLLPTYFNFICQPYRNTEGNTEGIFFFAINVTSQVLARHHIEESKKEYVHLVQNLPAAVYTCDADGKLLLYNKAAVDLWGREPEDNDRWCGSWKISNNENKNISLESCPMAQAIKEGKKILGEEIIIERMDGTKRHVIPYPSPSFNSAGEITGGINVLIDNTDRRKTELETLNLVDSLQSRNKVLGQFAYMVSHNLRAPIARILGLASIFDSDPADNKFIIEKISEATTNLDDVVKDINTIVSARNAGKIKREHVLFETKLKLIEQVLELEIKDSKALIAADFNQSPEIFTVESYLYSIMYNLLSNAIKYRNPFTPLRIQVETSEDEKFICLSVKDNGLGIDLKRNEGKVFGLYKRFHGDTIPGKGVGLHLVKVHAESLGGCVEVDSKPNEGTQFRIYFPKNIDNATL